MNAPRRDSDYAFCRVGPPGRDRRSPLGTHHYASVGPHCRQATARKVLSSAARDASTGAIRATAVAGHYAFNPAVCAIPMSDSDEGRTPSETKAFYLAGFTALRSEIDRRSTAQQGIIVIYLTGAGVTATVAARGGGGLFALLVLPFVSLAFARLYVDHHYEIQRIGAYNRELWKTRLSGSDTWEDESNKQSLGGPMALRHRLWRSPPLLIFVGTSFAALVGTMWMFAVSADEYPVGLKIALIST